MKIHKCSYPPTTKRIVQGHRVMQHGLHGETLSGVFSCFSLPGNLCTKQSQETLEYTLVKHKGDEKKFL